MFDVTIPSSALHFYPPSFASTIQRQIFFMNFMYSNYNPNQILTYLKATHSILIW